MTDEVQLKFRYFCKVNCLLHLSNPPRHEYGEEMEKGPGEIERTSCSVKKLLLIDEFTNRFLTKMISQFIRHRNMHT